jgi:hypothetical protein
MIMCTVYFHNIFWFNKNLVRLTYNIVFSTTFSNISAISWRPLSVVEEARVPGENHWSWASNWYTLSLGGVHMSSQHTVQMQKTVRTLENRLDQVSWGNSRVLRGLIFGGLNLITLRSIAINEGIQKIIVQPKNFYSFIKWILRLTWALLLPCL